MRAVNARARISFRDVTMEDGKHKHKLHAIFPGDVLGIEFMPNGYPTLTLDGKRFAPNIPDLSRVMLNGTKGDVKTILAYLDAVASFYHAWEIENVL